MSGDHLTLLACRDAQNNVGQSESGLVGQCVSVIAGQSTDWENQRPQSRVESCFRGTMDERFTGCSLKVGNV